MQAERKNPPLCLYKVTFGGELIYVAAYRKHVDRILSEISADTERLATSDKITIECLGPANLEDLTLEELIKTRNKP